MQQRLARLYLLFIRIRRDMNKDLFSVPGKQREADGYDETVLEGERGISVDAAGFEHPYGRGSVPPARVIALSPDALAQVAGLLFRRRLTYITCFTSKRS